MEFDNSAPLDDAYSTLNRQNATVPIYKKPILGLTNILKIFFISNIMKAAMPAVIKPAKFEKGT